VPGLPLTTQVVVVQDVTEQRRAEAELAESQARFHQAQRLESIGRLAGGVAHDFNNLLTVILSCAGALRRDVAEGQAPAADDIEEIHGAARRAADLTRQLLAFARHHAVDPVVLDLNETVRGCQRMLWRLLGEDVEVQVALQPGLWAVHADPGQVEQVLVNLAVNARDAMPAGGRLTIETRNLTVAPEAAGADPELHAGDWVRLTVRDTGTGMAPDVQVHLFEPFFTTKEQGRGTGLGLATVHGIVEQAGGHVHVRSRQGEGSTFEICLPRSTRPPAAAAAPDEEARGGSEAILLVEDDPLVREVALEALREGGYQVLALGHPQTALDLPDEVLARHQLLVTDVVMPGLSGAVLAQVLRRRCPVLRVLFVSGYAAAAAGPGGEPVVLAPLLAKPFTGATLRARVRAVLDGPAPGA
jgi:nitrogen-specific signal transduction histidine kinase/CheY-like chemotaxis protein